VVSGISTTREVKERFLPSRAVEFDLDPLPSGTPEELAGPLEAPVKLGQRLSTLDILRGVALLGVLMLNIQDFAGSEGLEGIPLGLAKAAFVGWHAHLDWAIVIFNFLIARGRMRDLFCMLLGAGVILLTERIEQRAGPGKATGVYYRRNLWLLLFGLIHGFVIWPGDVLVYYSVMALLFLPPLRRLSARTLIACGLAVWLLAGTAAHIYPTQVVEILHKDAQLTAAKAAGQNASPVQQALLAASRKAHQAHAAALAAALKDDIRNGQLGFLDGWPNRIETERNYIFHCFSGLFFVEMIGTMITGMGLYKAGFLTNRRPVREYVIVAIAGCAVALPLTLMGLWHLNHAGFTRAAYARWMVIPFMTEASEKDYFPKTHLHPERTFCSKTMRLCPCHRNLRSNLRCTMLVPGQHMGLSAVQTSQIGRIPFDPTAKNCRSGMKMHPVGLIESVL
jgi:uncharacterized protein